MKKHFITGIVILLPLTLTIWFVSFIFNLLTGPFIGISHTILDHFGLLDTGFLFLSANEVQEIVSKIFIIIFLFFFTVLLGILGRWVFIRFIFKIWDYILHRIPFVRSIYKTCQDVISTLFASKADAFQQVVLAPFPNSDTLTLGFVTRQNLTNTKNPESKNITAVFVPTTPNPTSGFLMLYDEGDLTYLDMKVEDAFKYIISCGVILTPLKAITKEEAQQISQNRDKRENNKPSEP